MQRRDLGSFPNLASELENQQRDSAQLDIERYKEQINVCLSEFDKRFQDFALLEPVATFMCNPFRETTDIGAVASRIASLFHMNTLELEDEILTLQADIQLKSMAQEPFWNLLREETYPNMRKCATFLTALFGSTYLCESAFSHMKCIKSKYRSTMTDDHLEACMRLTLSSYSPNYENLTDSLQCKSSQ
ncbi:hypothetical protein WMY93_002910 [Mugilogobius chulae]